MKTSFSGSYFAYLLHRSLFWLLLISFLCVLVQCGGDTKEDDDNEGGSGKPDGEPDLIILGTEVSSQGADIGDDLRVTITVRNQGAGTSGGEGSPRMVTFYRSDNKFISSRDQVLGTSSFGVLDPEEESEQSFPFIAMIGDNYYGACFETSNDCQIGVKVSVSIPDITGSGDYATCHLSREGGSSTFSSEVLSIGRTSTSRTTMDVGKEAHYLMKVEKKGILNIWSTGSSDMSALLFDGNCNFVNGHYIEDGGIGGENNFQIEATASVGYYFLVVHEKSLRVSTFETLIRLDDILMTGSDPLYPMQWHLDNQNDQEIDINAPEAWEITRGDPSVKVAVIDSEVEVSHPDLAPNHDDRYSVDNPFRGSHGTAVAGLIAAAGNNGIGVSGVAPEVSFISLGALGRSRISKFEALIKYEDKVAISNNSWGLESEGQFSPNHASYGAILEYGITNGYGGKGIFYVFGAGNEHMLNNVFVDNSNYDPLTKHYSVVAICAVGDKGKRSNYSEKGANLWLCAPSKSRERPGLTTTDVTGREGYNKSGDYVYDFTGTSASTPIVSGVAALMRSVNPKLGWRDMRLILAATAKKNDSNNPGWFQGVASYDGSNYSGNPYQHNHEYGFGLVNAQAAVMKSQKLA